MVSVFSVLLRLHIVVADKRLEDGAHAGGLILVVLAPRGAVLLPPLLGVAPLSPPTSPPLVSRPPRLGASRRGGLSGDRVPFRRARRGLCPPHSTPSFSLEPRNSRANSKTCRSDWMMPVRRISSSSRTTFLPDRPSIRPRSHRPRVSNRPWRRRSAHPRLSKLCLPTLVDEHAGKVGSIVPILIPISG
jgi:hypothetical protein